MITAVDRATRCIVGWDVVTERTTEIMQALLDRSVQAARYYSDDFSTYHTLIYDPGQHQAFSDKSQTYSVEGDNAELRHYLARLARASRCFSRSLQALWRCAGYPFHPRRFEAQIGCGTLHRHHEFYRTLECNQPCLASARDLPRSCCRV